MGGILGGKLSLKSWNGCNVINIGWYSDALKKNSFMIGEKLLCTFWEKWCLSLEMAVNVIKILYILMFQKEIDAGNVYVMSTTGNRRLMLHLQWLAYKTTCMHNIHRVPTNLTEKRLWRFPEFKVVFKECKDFFLLRPQTIKRKSQNLMPTKNIF